MEFVPPFRLLSWSRSDSNVLYLASLSCRDFEAAPTHLRGDDAGSFVFLHCPPGSLLKILRIRITKCIPRVNTIGNLFDYHRFSVTNITCYSSALNSA